MTKNSPFSISLYLVSCLLLVVSYCHGQCPDSKNINDRLNQIDWNKQLPSLKKLELAIHLKAQYESCGLKNDSVYAKILHKIGLWDYQHHNNKPTDQSIAYTLRSVALNTSGSKSSLLSFAVSGYHNIAIFYKSLKKYNQALLYFDSTILLSKKLGNFTSHILQSRYDKNEIYFQVGDYEHCIEESSYGILEARQLGDSMFILGFSNQLGQSHFFQGNIPEAQADIDTAILYATAIRDDYELASAYKIKAFIYEQLRNYALAISYYTRTINSRILSGASSMVVNDYLDFGNFYLITLRNNKTAKQYYLKALRYSPGSSDNAAGVYSSLGYAYFLEHNYKEAELCFVRFLKEIGVSHANSLLSPYNAEAFIREGNNELVLISLSNITEYLLQMYKETNRQQYLDACLRTALVTDTMITNVRYMQMGERSKLYWRNRTREFFSHAIEACYLVHDAGQAFYYMEKSRAVLLNDKLNELGAAAHLPGTEARQEQEHQARIIAAQQLLASTNRKNAGYNMRLQRLLEAKEDFKQYVRSLEKKFPSYYQYKYADSVPSLATLQNYVRVNGETFVHYFSNDTVTYVLGIRADSVAFLKWTKKEINFEQISTFLILCSNKITLNNNYPIFAWVSHRLFKSLFEPLHVPPGRVVICPDHFMIPFEALCRDSQGKDYLIYDYLFSYVYSARYLLKDFSASPAKGNFIGFAPVSFKRFPGSIDLKQSAVSLERASEFYNGTRLFTGEKATKRNFITQIAGYKIVNVFSHASADTTDNEPLLFMHDSVIHLSELQLLRNPAIELVVLSACQTNVGKNATGEGIYSLARGFASAGIPSVAATLWKADEDMIYAISEKFHEYLSENMRKDEALQKAKLFFMKNGNLQKQLPFFWANMILIGNADPIGPPVSHNLRLWAGGVAALLIIALSSLLFWRFRKR